jgi:pimeloyl-ACP methyl ester carboxylesterase
MTMQPRHVARWIASAAVAAAAVSGVSPGFSGPTRAEQSELDVRTTEPNGTRANLGKAPAGFRHGFADVDGVRMHYVSGGTGSRVVVLLHGWPQTWYEWVDLMPALARDYTVIAVDLPGLGGSRGEPSGYDKATLARYVHGLVAEELGYRRVSLVGHDMGGGVAYQYAAQHRSEVERLAILDFPLPGPIDVPTIESFSWHFGFNRASGGLPEQLIDRNDLRPFFDYFFDNFAARPDVIDDKAVSLFVKAYRDPDKLHAGFELYRTFDQDAVDNLESAQEPLQMPVLALSASEGSGEGGSGIGFTVRAVATDVTDVMVPDSGHWLPEENPEFVLDQLRDFLS